MIIKIILLKVCFSFGFNFSYDVVITVGKRSDFWTDPKLKAIKFKSSLVCLLVEKHLCTVRFTSFTTEIFKIKNNFGPVQKSDRLQTSSCHQVTNTSFTKFYILMLPIHVNHWLMLCFRIVI